MERFEVTSFIEKNMQRHLSNKVLHAHPSPALWRNDFDYEVTKDILLKDNGVAAKVNMYVDIPVGKC